jgi:hypothetical protein
MYSTSVFEPGTMLILLILVLVGVIVVLLLHPKMRRPTGITLGVIGGLLLLMVFFRFMREGNSSMPPVGTESPATESPAMEKTAAKSTTAPDWVGKPPGLVGDVYHMELVVGPYDTRQACNDELPNELQKALNQYVAKCLGEPIASGIALPADELYRDLVKEQPWEEIRKSDVLNRMMTRLHVLVEFDHKIKERILREHERRGVAGRLGWAGVGLASVLAILAAWYAYLRIDLATAGAYRGRLRLALAAAIMGVVAVVLITCYKFGI